MRVYQRCVVKGLLWDGADGPCGHGGGCGRVFVVDADECPNAQPNGEHLPTRQLSCTACVDGRVPRDGAFMEISDVEDGPWFRKRTMVVPLTDKPPIDKGK